MVKPKKKSKTKGITMHGEYNIGKSWTKILLFLRQEKRLYIGKEASCRKFVEGVAWMLRTGTQWRALPREYGKWNSVFKRFRSWAKRGIWQKLFEFFVQDPDLEYLMLDSTIVRANRCAAGYKKNSIEALGRSKGGFTSKIHALVDALGNPLRFIVTAGQRNDITQAKNLLQGYNKAFVLGDKGYDSDEFRQELLKQGCTPVIPSRSNRKNPYEYDSFLYKERNLIECFFAKIKNFRRVFSRFDKSELCFISFIYIAGSLIWLR